MSGDPTAICLFFLNVLFDTSSYRHDAAIAFASAYPNFIAANATGTSCLGPLAGSATTTGTLSGNHRGPSDRKLTTLILVSRPEPSALQRELAALGSAKRRQRRLHCVIPTIRARPPRWKGVAEMPTAFPETMVTLPRMSWRWLRRIFWG